jgi:phosphatidylserine decarboxylase
VLTARSWAAARRYVTPPLAAGLLITPARPRLGLPLLALAAGISLFFRDPARLFGTAGPAATPGTGLVYAPADGRITAAAEPAAGEPLLISTYLSIANVHVARSPAAGVLMSWDNRAGRRWLARSPQAAAVNRQARLQIRTDDATIGVTLVTGAVARQISQWVTPGTALHGGERLGIIHFGSRADLLLPAGRYDALVQPGDRVIAGVTPVARLRLVSTGDQRCTAGTRSPR